jgi:UDP-N-acetylglucosamine--N-acetylmuramyl-(pentapeptide) pyrophosphoryl-undecaprenol N-acetylglucosamine transferase
MEKVYLIADLAISRSGAMTVTELAAFGVRALLVPYPHAGGHQRENALVLTAANAARLIEEKDVSASVLARNIEELLKDRLPREEVVKRCNGIYRPDAAVRLAETIGNSGPA